MHQNSNETLAEVLKRASVFLEQKGHDASMARTYWLLAFDWTLTDLVRQLNNVISDDQKAAYSQVLERVVKQEPIQYIVGYADFMGERYTVTPHTLIPREDTAGLVERALIHLKNYPTPRILDIGTGSGIIAITLAKKMPHAQVTAVDISSEALEIARQNADAHQVAVEWIQSDVCKQLPAAQRFDIIISNPPYISQDEVSLMDASVLQYEPHLALFAEQNGLAIYKQIALESQHVIQLDGAIFLEIGFRQAEAVCAIFREVYPHASIRVEQDLNDLDRYVIIDLKGERHE
ncbi:MAG: peptide chain release factor N(5)-glutamine methyltransferase [Aerococcaceae bacterium]|nr:peptide chain release factor N(5)-glutamine methyltransferase [Aerococcaceae bacterium]